MIPKTEPFHWIADSQRHPIPEGLKSEHSIFAKEGSANFLSQQLLYMGSLCKNVYATCFPRNWCRMAHLQKPKEKPRLCHALALPLEFPQGQHQCHHHSRHHQSSVCRKSMVWSFTLVPWLKISMERIITIVCILYLYIYISHLQKKQILITEKYRETIESSPVSHPNSKPLST